MKPTLPDIASAITNVLMPATDLKLASRHRDLTIARGLAVCAARDCTVHGYVQISQHLLGRGSHTTAVESETRIREGIKAGLCHTFDGTRTKTLADWLAEIVHEAKRVAASRRFVAAIEPAGNDADDLTHSEAGKLVAGAVEAYSLWWELEAEDGINPNRVLDAMERLYRHYNNNERLRRLAEDAA